MARELEIAMDVKDYPTECTYGLTHRLEEELHRRVLCLLRHCILPCHDNSCHYSF